MVCLLPSFNKKFFVFNNIRIRRYFMATSSMCFIVFNPSISYGQQSGLTPVAGVSLNYNIFDDDTFYYEDLDNLGMTALIGLKFNNICWDFSYTFDSNVVATETNVDLSISMFETGLKYNYYLSPELYAYGRLGAAYWDIKKTSSTYEKASSTYEKYSINESGVSPIIGIGLGYDISNYLTSYAGYKYINGIGGGSSGSYDEHKILIGAIYKFGRSEAVENITEVIEPEIKNEVVVDIIKEEPKKEFIFMSFDSTNFSVNSSTLDSYDRFKFKKLIEFLNKYPDSRVEVFGHTDSTGPATSNEWLSLDRASSVSNLLLTNGISSKRITIHGAGEREPIATNETREGRAKNRRVEIVIPDFTTYETD